MARKKHYLQLDLDGAVSESPPSFNPLQQKKSYDLARLLEVIHIAGRKAGIEALLLTVKNLTVGWAQLAEIREGLLEFRRAGKKVYCHLEQADHKAIALAAGADRVAVAPAVTLDLVGLRAETFFFKNLFDLLGVEAQLFNVGLYKSAAEAFQREQMSKENREMTRALLEDFQGQFVGWIAEARKVPVDTVRDWIDRGPWTARKAREIGLVDEVVYGDELAHSLEEGQGLRPLSASRVKPGEGFFRRLLTYRRPQVAYIVAEGILAGGSGRKTRGRRQSLGHRTVAGFLDQARKSKRVKAIVLRVNSPGGSTVASDLLWRAARRAAEAKPLVVSFGDVAASGGYYVATASSTIFADPTTITGSIGVIGGKFVLRDLFTKLGVSVDSIDLGERAGYTSPARPFTETEAAALQEQLRDFYEELFLPKVATRKGKSTEEIRPFAEGRVWTGRQAQEISLVDELGGLRRALASAAEQAGLKTRKYRIKVFSSRSRLADLLPWPTASLQTSDRLAALMPEIRIF